MELATALCRESKRKTACSRPSSHLWVLCAVPRFCWKQLGFQGPEKEGTVHGDPGPTPRPEPPVQTFPKVASPHFVSHVSMRPQTPAWAGPEQLPPPGKTCPIENSRQQAVWCLTPQLYPELPAVGEQLPIHGGSRELVLAGGRRGALGPAWSGGGGWIQPPLLLHCAFTPPLIGAAVPGPLSSGATWGTWAQSLGPASPPWPVIPAPCTPLSSTSVGQVLAWLPVSPQPLPLRGWPRPASLLWGLFRGEAKGLPRVQSLGTGRARRGTRILVLLCPACRLQARRA